MATSLEYNFANIDVDLIIRDAFQRCGILNYEQDALRYKSARTSLDFVFSHWINRGLNLFTVTQNIIQIVNGQFIYSMPPNTSKILEGILVSANRILGGTPSSSAGGDPTQPFATTITGSCAQITSNGNISYLYTTAQSINYVGVMSQTTQNYTLSIDCSFLAVPGPNDWINIMNTSKQSYYFGLTNWFSLPTTQTAMNWRIRETGGATLNIAQIFFNVPFKSQPMNPEGREDYTKQTINTSAGTAATYWANRINPLVVKIYGTPNNSAYQFFVFNCVRYIQDCGDFQNSTDTNSRFIEPATAGLAAKLAEKYAPDRADRLAANAEIVYIQAGQEDTENVPSQVQFSMDGGFA